LEEICVGHARHAAIGRELPQLAEAPSAHAAIGHEIMGAIEGNGIEGGDVRDTRDDLGVRAGEGVPLGRGGHETVVVDMGGFHHLADRVHAVELVAVRSVGREINGLTHRYVVLT
jgi:hypothetical protein